LLDLALHAIEFTPEVRQRRLDRGLHRRRNERRTGSVFFFDFHFDEAMVAAH
jgi:hypothetical protein